MLAVARGLMSRPKILLLDEPSMGLAPIIVNQIYDLIKQIRDSGITVLLVEQNARKALGICDYAYVLENGKNQSVWFRRGAALLRRYKKSVFRRVIKWILFQIFKLRISV